MYLFLIWLEMANESNWLSIDACPNDACEAESLTDVTFSLFNLVNPSDSQDPPPSAPTLPNPAKQR